MIKSGKKCQLETCPNKSRALGFCTKHYHRLKKYGDPNITLINRGEGKTPQERFWSRTHKTDSCWYWLGSLNEDGYGKCSISINGTRYSLANRVAYFFYYGIEPKESKVCHTCDNPQCVNPDHLFLGTVETNMSDMVSKNRSCKGEQRSNAKLNVSKVKEIRRIYAETTTNYNELGRQFGVNPSVIRGIVLRQKWAHVE